MVSTLVQVLAYTGAFWLLLVLWAALFKALKIDFFTELKTVYVDYTGMKRESKIY